MPPKKSPGPAEYTLKPLVGYKDHDLNSQKRRGPQVTLGIQLDMGIENKSPGPAAHSFEKETRFGLITSVATTMYKRTKELKRDQNPGPAHNPVNPSIYKWKFNPKYTQRMMTKPLKLDQGPGPQSEPTPLNIYKPRNPKFPFLSKNPDLTPDLVPGSATYNTCESKMKTIKQFPAYSHKWNVREISQDKIPGPNVYGLSEHNPFDRAPGYTMGKKYCEYAFVPIVPMDNCRY